METSENFWISREELSSRLKIPVKTLAQWASQRKGPRFAKIGRFARYKMTDVVAWEEAQFGGADAA